ncbi:MAG: substrate-binding domain-containing protein [Dysosmobacter sp.]
MSWCWTHGGPSRDTLDRNGDGVIQYGNAEGEPGHQDALLRTEFCISTLANAGVSAEKLASDAANWQRGQASVSMRQWLQEFGENIEVVFANNDDMALGAIDACAEAGMDKAPCPSSWAWTPRRRPWRHCGRDAEGHCPQRRCQGWRRA